MIKRPIVKRPDYMPHIDNYFGTSLKTKAALQSYANTLQPSLLAKWQSNYDLAIYDDDDYIWDALQCYEKVTSPVVRGIAIWLEETGQSTDKSFIDVWNGCGISSIQAAQLGLRVSIVNNSPKQLELCQYLAKQMLGSEFPVLDLNTTEKFDIVGSFEVLEHYRKPKVHLDELMRLVKAKGALAIGTGFTNADNVGHYSTHSVDGQEVENRKVPRLLDKHLVMNGYQKVFSYFNGRPRIWSKK